MNALIIDDELPGRMSLRQKLHDYCPEVNIIGEAENGREGIDMVQSLHPDLVFLDIEMPEMNGFEMLLKIPRKSFHLIFTTAYDHYAIKAIKYAAFDYLLKPIDIDELKLTLSRLTESQSPEINHQKLEALEQNLLSKPFLNKIAIPTGEGLMFYDLQDIIHLEADSNYTTLYFEHHPKLLASRTLKDFEDILPPEIFFRPHNSHIINLKFVKRYIRGDGGQVELTNGTYVLVARKRKEEFLKRIGR